MATPPQGERVRQLELTLQNLSTTVDYLRTQASGFGQLQEDFRLALAALDKENAVLRQALAEQARRFDDHVRRAGVWGQRWWALVPVLVGAVLSLCYALIVALARK